MRNRTSPCGGQCTDLWHGRGIVRCYLCKSHCNIPVGDGASDQVVRLSGLSLEDSRILRTPWVDTASGPEPFDVTVPSTLSAAKLASLTRTTSWALDFPIVASVTGYRKDPIRYSCGSLAMPAEMSTENISAFPGQQSSVGSSK
jgi:hypothetical protein